MVKLGIICHYLQRVFQVVGLAAHLGNCGAVARSALDPDGHPRGAQSRTSSNFVATGAAFGLGYPRRFLFLPVALLTFTAAIEVAQMLVPGRHARERLSDRRSGLLCRNWTFVCLGKINGRYEQRLSLRYGRC